MLRLATLNLLHGMSLTDGRTDAGALEQTGALLDADVVGLQEVDRLQPRSGRVDQAACVAAGLGAPFVHFAPSLRGTPGGGRPTWTAWPDGAELTDEPTYGVALISRLPVRSWSEVRFPPAPFGLPLLVPATPRPRVMRVADEPRLAVAAVLETDRGPMTVITAHLSFVPGYNLHQLRSIIRWADTLPSPRVLLGDLNLPGRVPARFSGWNQLARGATYPSYGPRLQLDHVLGDGLRADAVTSAEVLRAPVSDHCAVRVSLSL